MAASRMIAMARKVTLCSQIAGCATSMVQRAARSLDLVDLVVGEMVCDKCSYPELGAEERRNGRTSDEADFQVGYDLWDLADAGTAEYVVLIS